MASKRRWSSVIRVRACAGMLLLATAALTAGCATTSSSTGTSSSGEAHADGGTLRLDSTGSTHQLVFTAPSAGWSLTFDRVEVDGSAQRLYVTARRPDPTKFHAQQLVDLRLDTTVPSTTPIRVNLRTLNHGQTSGQYREVIR